MKNHMLNLALLGLCLSLSVIAFVADWPQFRGPKAHGTAAEEADKHILTTVDPAAFASYRARVDRLARTHGIPQAVGHFALREARGRIADADALMRESKPEEARAQVRAADAAAAAVDFDKLKWRAATGFGDAAGVETDELLILMNRDMALAFDRTTFRLCGLYDPASNHMSTF